MIVLKMVYTESTYKTTTKDIFLFLVNVVTRDLKPACSTDLNCTV